MKNIAISNLYVERIQLCITHITIDFVQLGMFSTVNDTKRSKNCNGTKHFFTCTCAKEKDCTFRGKYNTARRLSIPCKNPAPVFVLVQNIRTDSYVQTIRVQKALRLLRNVDDCITSGSNAWYKLLV